MKISLSQKVKIKLTKKGLDAHYHDWEKDCFRDGGFPEQFYSPPLTDEEGYSEFSLEGLMWIFGQYPDKSEIFESDVEIQLCAPSHDAMKDYYTS